MKNQIKSIRMSGPIKFKILVLSLIGLLTACALERPAPLVEDKKIRLINTLIEQNNFMGIFDHRNELVDISPGNTKELGKPVEKFILNCCSDKASAIKLLKDNGFSVSPIKDWTAKGYDEAYHGKRFSQPINLMFATQYHVSIYVNNGKVKKVTSAYFRDYKPAKPHSANYKPRMGFNN